MNPLLNKCLGELNAAPLESPRFSLTPEQEKIVDLNLMPGDAHKVIAYAGTGKTSTFVAYTKARPNTDFTYLAFNKSVETEGKAKFGTNVLCKTVHAMAFGVVGRNYGKIMPSVANWQIAKILRAPIYEATLVSKTLENFFNSAEPVIDVRHVEPDHLNKLDGAWEENIVRAATAIWTAMQNQSHDLFMTHSGYLKLYQLSKPTLPGDIILLDEAQDTNPVTQDIVLSQLTKGKAVLLCGDPYQQIYAWRGAVDALEEVCCEASYLTNSFRFGSEVASHANALLQTFFGEKRPLIGRAPVEPPPAPTATRTTICRTNTAIFFSAVADAQAKRPFHVVGQQQFHQMLDTLLDVYHLWSNHTDRIVERRISRFRKYGELCEYAQNTLDIELQSRCAVVEKFGSETPELVQQVRAYYKTDPLPDTPVYVTGHKAKGLEWNYVTLAGDFKPLYDENGDLIKDKEKLPHEEINLLYVAATRARKHLIPTAGLHKLTAVVNAQKPTK